MNPKHRVPKPILLFALAFVLPLAISGCGKRACFFWTEAEGACPAQEEAIDFFGDGPCGSSIESVDSDGDFDGELCCYDVSEQSGLDDAPCGVTGAGGFSSGGSSTFTVSSGVEGSSSCGKCGPIATSIMMGVFMSGLCTSSQILHDDLQTCLCGATGACQPICQSSVCALSPATTECFDCGTDSAVGCGAQFSNCANDM